MAKGKKKEFKPKFDWNGFKLSGGIGLFLSACGALIFWATYTAPPGGPSQSYALSTTQRLVRMLPHDMVTRIALVLSVLFILFGLFLILSAIYSGLRFLLIKR